MFSVFLYYVAFEKKSASAFRVVKSVNALCLVDNHDSRLRNKKYNKKIFYNIYLIDTNSACL